MAISGDGRYAAAPQRSLSRAHVVDLQTGEMLHLLQGEQFDTIQSVAVSHDGRLVATGTGSLAARVVIWDLQTGEQLRTIEDLPSASLDFTPGDEQLIACGGRTVRTVDVASGRVVGEMGGRMVPTRALVMGPEGRTALSGGQSLWSLDTLSVERTLAGSYGGVTFHAGGGWRQLYTEGYPTRSIFLRDLETGIVLREIETGHESVPAYDVSADGRLGLLGDGEGRISLWDLDGSAHLRDFEEFYREDIRSLAFSPDGRLALSGADRPIAVDLSATLVIWDVETGEEIVRLGGQVDVPTPGEVGAKAHWAAVDRAHANLEGHIAGVRQAVFSPDGRRVVSGGGKGEVFVWDVATGALLTSLEGHDGTVEAVAFSPDGARVVTGGDDRSVRLWDAVSGDLLRTREGHTGAVEHVGFLPDGEHVYSAADDGTTRLWQTDGEGSLILLTDGGEWLVVDDTGLFDASRDGGSLLAAVRGLDVFQLEQLALRNNRPDLLLKGIGIGSADLIDHYRIRHERRLRKAGLGAEDLAAAFERVPTARIAEVVQQGPVAEVIFDLEDPDGGLFTYNVYVNGVPLFGAAGRPTSGAKQRITEPVELTEGANRVEVGTVNRGGAASLRDFRVLQLEDKPPGDLYFLGFGVSSHRDPDLDLAYADRDVLDLAAALDQRTEAFGRVHVQIHVNEQVTADAIRGARGWLESAGVDDTVLVMVAGHGTYTDDAEAEYYFVVHDTDLDRLRETAVSFAQIEGLLDGIAPRRKLLLMDTCASGELAEDTRTTLAAAGGARGLTARVARGLEVAREIPAPASRPYLFERDRYIYNDLSRRTGAIVLSSSLGSELSYEQDTLENGVFTEELIAALTTQAADADEDGAVSTEELREYVSTAVAARTGGLQHPTVDRDNVEGRFALPILLGDDPPLRLVVPHDHEGAVNGLSLSADGRRVLTGGKDGTVKLWEVDTGVVIRTFEGHSGAVKAVALSPDGRTAISGDKNGQIRFWDVETGRVIDSPSTHASSVTDIEFSPDGALALVSSGNPSDDLVLWDVSGPRVLHEWCGHEWGPQTVAFTPDGSLTISAGSGADPENGVAGPRIQVWDADSTGRRTAAFDVHDRRINDLAVSQDGEGVLSASDDDTVRLWDLGTGEVRRTLYGHGDVLPADGPGGKKKRRDGDVNRVVYLDTAGQRALSGGDDGRLVFLELTRDADTVTRIKAHSKAVTGLAVTPDRQRALSCSADGTVKLWDLATLKKLRQFDAETEELNSVALTPDGRYAAAGGDDNDLRIWDLAEARLVRRIKGHSKNINTVAVSGDGRLVATGGADRGIRLWDLASGRERRTIPVEESVLSLAFSGDGTRLAAGMKSGVILLFQVSSGRIEQRLEGHGKAVYGLTFAPEGGGLLSGSLDQTLRTWDVRSGVEVGTFAGHTAPIFGSHLSPDGTRAASASKDGTIRVWDVATGESLVTLEGHDATVLDVAFAPDGQRLVSAGRDTTVRIWDLARGECVQVLEGHDRWVRSVRFHPGGEHVLSASEDGSLRLWHLETGHSVSLVGGGEEWIAYSDEGYYAASAAGSELVRAIQDRRSIRLARLAPAKHRPDRLLEAAGLADAETVERSRAARAKRLETLGLDPDQVSGRPLRAPRVEILGVREDRGGATVSFRIRDEENGLLRYRVLVDGVALHGSAGREIEGRDVELAQVLPASDTSQEVGIDALNAVGVWSDRTTVIVAP